MNCLNCFQIMLIEKWILLKSLEFRRQHKNWFKKYSFSYIAHLYIFIFLLKIWRNVRHGFARGYWAVQNVLAIQCQRPKPSFGRGSITWRSSLAIGRYCQRRWGCLPQSECIYLLGCAALRAASKICFCHLTSSFVANNKVVSYYLPIN